tara:strand:+ start:1898 stop:2104 length:207 start_codon:yes stop_codon:yes gene_type:complete
MDNEYIGFEDSLDEDDFGLIICGKTGNLKGLFIPRGKEEEEIPDTIVEICLGVFGIDPNDTEDEVTLH